MIKQIVEALKQAKADKAQRKAMQALGRRPMGGWDRSK